jgi:hypothetical protein
VYYDQSAFLLISGVLIQNDLVSQKCLQLCFPSARSMPSVVLFAPHTIN